MVKNKRNIWSLLKEKREKYESTIQFDYTISKEKEKKKKNFF